MGSAHHRSLNNQRHIKMNFRLTLSIVLEEGCCISFRPIERRLMVVIEYCRAVIKADGKVLHERVMHVLDLLRRAGISKIGFGVIPLAVEAQPKSQRK